MKNTYRFFVAPSTIADNRVQIDDRDLLRQWVQVLRLRAGDQVLLLDGTGYEHTVELLSLDKQAATGRVIASAVAQGEPQLQITLVIALTRGERFEWVLQKGTELGAIAFVPLLCERSVVEQAKATKRERWERIMREAAEQAQRGRVPSLHPAVDVATALASLSSGIVLDEQATQPFRQVVDNPHATAISLWSGPEGGWSDGERQAMQTAGLQFASLGPRILRAETAPIAALAALMFASNEWQTSPRS